MRATFDELMETVKSKSLTYEQKHHALSNIAERLVDPIEILGYTEDEMDTIENNYICDLNEGYAIYRPRYIVPDYSVFVENGSEFLDIKPPKTLDELLDGLMILYHHVPSITSFPVFIGNLDELIDYYKEDSQKHKLLDESKSGGRSSRRRQRPGNVQTRKQRTKNKRR